MAKKIENIPNASTLIFSMRSIGYDFKAAIADIIDNSISAEAENIEIYFPTSHEEDIFLQIIDDGFGMENSELFEAMRFGSVKDEGRSMKDLGRFGLGLKTASISQCKRVTVISKKNGKISGFCWDLDLLSVGEGWDMYELTNEEIETGLKVKSEILENPSWTVVLWEKFDTLDAETTVLNNEYDVFTKRISSMEEHLALIFHRFLEEGLSISVNKYKIIPLDPFLSKHPKTTMKPEQIINTKTKDNKDVKVKMQVFVLPYFKDRNKNDDILMGGTKGAEHQGFYIYRNKRLMIYGTWFRIRPKAELSSNARIKVDIPNTLDDLWSIDIKKQKAIIPSSLLNQLKTEVSNAVESSIRTHTYKGDNQTKSGSIWKKTTNPRDKSVFYEINKDSELIKGIIDKVDEKIISNIEKLFNLIELSLPYKDIYNSVAEKKDINQINAEKKDELLLQAYAQFQVLKAVKNLSNEQIIEKICSLEPFSRAEIKESLEEKVYGRR